MKLVIIQYNSGNIKSVGFAFERLGINPVITNDPEVIAAADKVIFPGVGAAGSAMAYLNKEGLDRLIPRLKQPVLGICLGMQLMCRYSGEDETKCLGIFEDEVARFSGDGKIPQIGWNQIYKIDHPLFKGVSEQSDVYFVHSYCVKNSPHAIATTDYMGEFSSAMHRDNFYGVQFHPEKSGETGNKILSNFLEL